jgi:hypothetical protein
MIFIALKPLLLCSIADELSIIKNGLPPVGDPPPAIRPQTTPYSRPIQSKHLAELGWTIGSGTVHDSGPAKATASASLAETLAMHSSPMDKLAATIAKHPFAQGLRTNQLEILARCSMETHLSKGQLVFSPGDLANRFHLIQTGRVILESPLPRGKWFKVQIIGPGETLGWSRLFEPYRWHFRARAMQRTTAIFFYGTRLRAECEENTALGYEVVKLIALVAIQRLERRQARLLKRSSMALE